MCGCRMRGWGLVGNDTYEDSGVWQTRGPVLHVGEIGLVSRKVFSVMTSPE